MLDKPQKTQALLAALEEALPFEVTLTDFLLRELRGDPSFSSLEPRQVVSKVSYAGDEGGIVCHIVPQESHPGIHLSITHVRVGSLLPFAAAVADYQKHRIKKLKKSGQGRP